MPHASSRPAHVVTAAVCLVLASVAAEKVHAEIGVKPSWFPGDLDVAVDGQPFLERFSVDVALRGADLPARCSWPNVAAASAGDRIALACRAGDVNATLRIEQVGKGVARFALDFDRERELAAQDGVRLTAAVPGLERGTAFARTEPWWLRPVFFAQQDFLGSEVQLVLAQRAKDYVALLPLAAGGASGWARGAHLPVAAGGITIGLDAGAPWSVRSAPLAVVAAGGSPYALVADVYRHGLDAMGNPGRLRTQKPYPDALTRVGFCTWNSFYENQTQDNLLGAARAIRAARFPLGFLIVDAGWQQALPGSIFFQALQSFQADPKKIPGGLEALVRELRAITGARTIGVWHALQGVPGGVDPASPLAAEQAGRLWKGVHGTLIPDPTSSRGEAFFRDFYRYLKASGVDLVKVDFQNWLESHIQGRLPQFQAMQQSVYNFHAAAKEAFGDAVINCMSMGHNLLFNLRDTNIVRNSLDYLLPEGPLGHRRHIVNNVFNSLPVQQVAYPDFDMWEAYGDFAVYHSVLRSLSGGPVYVTGDVARQDWALLRRLILSDGSVLRTDVPAVPTRDSLFVDPGEVAVPLKAFSRVGAVGLLGVFNALENGGAVSGQLRAADVDGLAGERFAVLEYFSRRLRVVAGDEAIPLQLAANQAQLYWVAPIEHGAAVFGLLEKYVAPRTVLSRQDDGGTLRATIAEAGTLGVYLERAPRSVRVDGRPAAPDWKDGLLRVAIEQTGPPRAHEIEIAR